MSATPQTDAESKPKRRRARMVRLEGTFRGEPAKLTLRIRDEHVSISATVREKNGMQVTREVTVGKGDFISLITGALE